MTRFWLTKEVNGNLYNALNAQLRNQQNQLQGTGKKSTKLHPTIGNKCCTGRTEGNNQVIY